MCSEGRTGEDSVGRWGVRTPNPEVVSHGEGRTGDRGSDGRENKDRVFEPYLFLVKQQESL